MALRWEADTGTLIGAAMEVHGELGKGFLEAVYQEAFEIELAMRNIAFLSQPRMRISYKGKDLRQFYVPDLVAFGDIPIELKAHAEPLSNADLKQILNSLRSCNAEVGLIFNFGRNSLDFKRVVA